MIKSSSCGDLGDQKLDFTSESIMAESAVLPPTSSIPSASGCFEGGKQSHNQGKQGSSSADLTGSANHSSSVQEIHYKKQINTKINPGEFLGGASEEVANMQSNMQNEQLRIPAGSQNNDADGATAAGENDSRSNMGANDDGRA